jgi:hypothetical protein
MHFWCKLLDAIFASIFYKLRHEIIYERVDKVVQKED